MDRIVFSDGTVFVCPRRAQAAIHTMPTDDGRTWKKICVTASAQEVAEAFVSGVRYWHEWDTEESVIRDDLSAYSVAGDVVDTRDGNITVYMGKPPMGEVAQGELTEILEGDAAGFTDTKLVDLEPFIQLWKPGMWQVGKAVCYEGQVYRVLQSHDSTGNEGWTPAAVPALFGVCHTKNPAKAKPWVQPQGTSGVYTLGDCYLGDNGRVWRQIYDGDNVYDATATPDRWEAI